MSALDPVVKVASAIFDSELGDIASKPADSVEKLVIPLINMLSSCIMAMHAQVFTDGSDFNTRGYQDMQDMTCSMISRLVVMPKLSYQAAVRVAELLALAMCSESSIEVLRPAHVTALSSGARMLDMASNLLGDAAREAAATPDEEDYRGGGVDSRHVLVIILSRAHSLFIRYSACFAPKVRYLLHTVNIIEI